MADTLPSDQPTEVPCGAARAHHPDALPQRGGDGSRPASPRPSRFSPAAGDRAARCWSPTTARTDGSLALAQRGGARVVAVAERGYGAALRAGIAAARGRFVIMGDADDSYDFSDLDAFVAKLRDGCDLVMGNRFAGGIAPGAMPLLHRYLGNPVLSLVGRLFFRAEIGDFHCGLRGFRRDAILALDLRTSGMEFASEMVVRAALAKLDHRRSADDACGRRAFAAAASAHLARRLAASSLSADVQPALAVPLSGPCADGARRDRHRWRCFPARSWLRPGSGSTSIPSWSRRSPSWSAFRWSGFGVIARHFAAANGLLPPSRPLTALLSAVSLERGLLIAVGIVGRRPRRDRLVAVAMGARSISVPSPPRW